jgi:hypothetical protein
MANQPDVPAHLYRALNERLRTSDKEAAIELYYELLSSGRSVGEILEGAGPIPGKPPGDGAATTQHPRSEPGAAASPAAPGTVPAGAAPADACSAPETIPDAAARERPWSGRVPGIVKSIAFWALYTGAVAAVSIAGFSVVRGDRAADPAIVRAHPNPAGKSATGAAAVPERPEAVAVAPEPERPVASVGEPPPSETAPPGGPGAAVPEPVEPIPVGRRKIAATAPPEPEAAQPPPAERPDALERLIEELTAPAARDPVPEPVPPVAQSASAVPAGAADAAPHPDGSQPEAGRADAASREETGALPAVAAAAPHGSAPAAASAGARDAGTRDTGRRQASAPRRAAEADRVVRRRTAARHSRAVDAGQGSRAYYPNQGAAVYFPDPARGYGHGLYGPAPYSDTGN